MAFFYELAGGRLIVIPDDVHHRVAIVEPILVAREGMSAREYVAELRERADGMERVEKQIDAAK